MANDTRLSDLAKEVEYLEAEAKDIGATQMDRKIVISISVPNAGNADYSLVLDAPEAQELKESILTIIQHGIMRIKKELRGEL